MCRILARLLVVTLSVTTWSIAASPVQAQIPAEVLKDIKAATVFVKVRTSQGARVGSGFLMQVEGDRALIVTNNHVVANEGPPSSASVVEVVLDSGRKTERVFSARVLAADVFRDLAILEINDAKDLPKPLNLLDKVEPFETMTVYIVGFPFGKMLASTKGNPAVTIGKGTVSSLRENDLGQVKVVQIDGDLNPGNSGGPVVDSKGRLIGVAVAKLVGTNIGLAIPPSELTAMAVGRVDQIIMRTIKSQETSAEIEIELVLIDPLRQIRKASARVIPAEKLEGNPPQDKNGKFLPVPDAQVVELKIQDQKCIGSFTAKSDGRIERQYRVQPVYARGDNDLVYSVAGSPQLVRFARPRGVTAAPTPPPNQVSPPNIKPKQPKLKPNATASSSTPLAKPSPRPPEAPVQDPAGESQSFGEVKVTKLNSPFTVGPNCICWSNDAASFYHLDGAGTVRRITIPGGEQSAILETGTNCDWISVSKRGLVLTVSAKQEMWLLDPKTLRVLSKKQVGAVQRLVSTPMLDLAYSAEGKYPDETIIVVDLKSGETLKRYESEDFKQRFRTFGGMVISPNGKYLFCESREELMRFAVTGSEIILEEFSPRIVQGRSQGICVSSDSELVCIPSGGGNYPTQGITPYLTYIYSTKSFKKIERTVTYGPYPQAIGFDLKAGLLYGQNHKHPLIVGEMTGKWLKDVDFIGFTSDSSIRQYLVHPQGGKMVVVGALGIKECQLWYVEMPVKGKVADATGRAPAESPVVAKSPESRPAPRVELPVTNKSPAAAPPPVEPPVTRKWTDASGSFSVDATLVEIKEGSVSLRATNGKRLSIPLDKLSTADQQYIASFADKKSKP